MQLASSASPAGRAAGPSGAPAPRNTAYRNRDRDKAKAHLEAALEEASRLRFSLGDVITRVEFTPERRQNPEWYRVLGRRDTEIAVEPAVIVDYTVKVPERMQPFSAREAYFVHNSHLFICTFIGLEESLAVFDAMLASIEFPSQAAPGLDAGKVLARR